MKKVFMLLMVAFMTFAMSQTAQAIENPNPKGSSVLGIHGGYYPGFGANVTYDYTLIDSWWKGHFTVGAFVGYNTRAWHYDGYYYDYTERWTNIGIMPRATYGLNITKDFEVHAGVMLGIAMRHYSYTYDYHYTNWYDDDVYSPYNHWGFCYGSILGARYYFTPKIGVEVEMNYSGYMSWFNAGVTIKL